MARSADSATLRSRPGIDRLALRYAKQSEWWVEESKAPCVHEV
jgi:hypothetical protein